MSSDVQKSEEKTAEVNGIEIVYACFGDLGDTPMLLIMGLGGISRSIRVVQCPKD